MIKLLTTKMARKIATRVSIFAAKLLKWAPNIMNIFEPKIFTPTIKPITNVGVS